MKVKESFLFAMLTIICSFDSVIASLKENKDVFKMQVYYNTETKDKKYAIWSHGSDTLPRGFKCFNEKIDNPEAPRQFWTQIINMAAIEKQKRKRSLAVEPMVVQVESVEALQAKDKAHFDKLIAQVTKHGACVNFVKENIMLNNEITYEQGVNKDFDLAMAKLEAKSAKTDKSQRVHLPETHSLKKGVIEI